MLIVSVCRILLAKPVALTLLSSKTRPGTVCERILYCILLMDFELLSECRRGRLSRKHSPMNTESHHTKSASAGDVPLSCYLITGSTACSASLPVFNLLRGRF